MAGTPKRQSTYPLSYSSRHKPRRWPLVLRFVKGAIHADILLPVVLHSAWAALIVYLNNLTDGDFALPNGIIPSLSIVVGLMLVFRNQTSYDRFWTGRQQLTSIVTGVRNLTRSFLLSSSPPNRTATAAERTETDHAVCTLIAMLYAVKNHLRADWGSSFSIIRSEDDEADTSSTDAHSLLRATHHSFSTFLPNALSPPAPPLSPSLALPPSYTPILTPHFTHLLHRGLSLPLSLTLTLERHINYMQRRLGLAPPLASALSTQVANLTASFSAMETIRLTPLPVAHLIHTKQVLALYCAVIPLGLVADMAYWAIPVAMIVCFTLYGIEGIGRQLEDPFGRDRNDIRMDDIVEDVRVEVEVMLEEWRKGEDWFADLGGGSGGDSAMGGSVGDVERWRQSQENTRQSSLL
ncbi:UPF0187-domain-containing protein [Viridothelium virens]|uniref:UPF0187-domain-containing protein n=1 Tax=Viridothelium virens TaxID=1048519 RepID=A0A6A6HLS8_VIRVR|nr:UPF0187-domain-containing protein [Viridothelium virens]